MLRSIGETLDFVGRGDSNWPKAINRFQIGSAKLQFGMLVGLLNEYEKVSQGPGGVPALSSRTITKNEVEINRYDWKDVALAVDILAANGEVEDRSVVDQHGLADREICLTPKGLISYYTEVYPQKYEDKQRAKALDLSVIEAGKASLVTGKATVRLFWATVIIALATIATALLPYLNDNEKNDLRKQVLEQQRKLEKLEHSQLPNGGTFPATQKPLIDSVSRNHTGH